MRARVHAGDPAGWQAQVDAWLQAPAAGRRAVVAESAFAPLSAPVDVPLLRLAAGCPCCLGQVPLRVGLVRLLRAERPDELLVLIGRPEHAARLRAVLADGSLGVSFQVDATES